MNKPYDPYPEVPDPPPLVTDTGFSTGQQRQYHVSALNEVCRLLGQRRLYGQVVAEAKQRGQAIPSFDLFNELFDFPVTFSTGKIKGVRFLALPDLFNRFEKCPLGRAFLEEVELRGDAALLCLIFRWIGHLDESGKQQTIKGGQFMTVHNYGSGSLAPAARFVTAVKVRGALQEITLETLASFMSNFTGWSL